MMKIRPVGAELFHADVQTDGHDKANSRCSQFFRTRLKNPPRYFPIYIQQKATLQSLFYFETALHVLGVTITHHQDCKQLYLQHLVCVTPYATHSTLKPVPTDSGR